VRPRFSIILPTYNRRDTIVRAVGSVQKQSFGDWELLIIDDGSEDRTSDVLPTDDSRIKVLSQPNRGVTSARNFGLRERRGELVTFLDSDDRWLPHFLELANAFFKAFPREQVFAAESRADWGQGFFIRHSFAEVSDWFPETAGRIGSRRFGGAPPMADPYLRVYSSREVVGAWGAAIVESAGHPPAFHYRGRIFEDWRWGWLMGLVGTVLTTAAVDRAGPFDESYRITSDYPWLAKVCRQNVTNMISVPAFIKYEFGVGGGKLAEDHLVWGKNAVTFHRELLRGFYELYGGETQTAELRGLRAHWQFLLAKVALASGDRSLALSNLRGGPNSFGGMERIALRFLLLVVPNGGLARQIYRVSSFVMSSPGKLFNRIKRYTR